MSIDCHSTPLIKAIGQVIYLRTDCSEYSEERVSFETLEQLVHLCREPKENRLLEKVIIFSQNEKGTCSICLAFVSASVDSKTSFFLP